MKILVTTALVQRGLVYSKYWLHNDHDAWNRTALYADTFRALARLGYPQPLVAEAVHTTTSTPTRASSMLERYGEVVYTSMNEGRYAGNQGVNEARSLLVALAHARLPTDTMLVKLTGRYSFVDASFFQVCPSQRHRSQR